MTTEPYDAHHRLYPQYVNVKRLNAIFLDTFIFSGKYPVRTAYPRDNIELPVGIYVDNANNRLKMMGMDYYGAKSTGNYGINPSTGQPYTQGTPWITNGLEAHGDVNVTVIANDPFIRDQVLGEIISGYVSYEGRCWFSGRSDVVVHGYNVIGSRESEFSTELGSKVHYLYTATLAIEFIYDIVTTKILNYIEDIRDYVVVSEE